MEYIDLTKLNFAESNNGIVQLTIHPYQYTDGRNPRLPRKSSKRYTLMKDTAFCFDYSFKRIQNYSNSAKFSVKIKVSCGKDRLGAADLDNYCKAILDGITATQKVWKDDRQVDAITVTRKYTMDSASSINVEIAEL